MCFLAASAIGTAGPTAARSQMCVPSCERAPLAFVFRILHTAAPVNVSQTYLRFISAVQLYPNRIKYMPNGDCICSPRSPNPPSIGNNSVSIPDKRLTAAVPRNRFPELKRNAATRPTWRPTQSGCTRRLMESSSAAHRLQACTSFESGHGGRGGRCGRDDLRRTCDRYDAGRAGLRRIMRVSRLSR